MHTRVDRAGADQGREGGMGSAREDASMHADPHSERCALFMHRQLHTMHVTSVFTPCMPLPFFTLLISPCWVSEKLGTVQD